jgi:hypothetical protein
MRGRLIGALAAGAALVASVVISGTASAEDATWTVTAGPGGAFTGSAGTTLLEIQESGIQLSCVSATAAGTATPGTGVVNPLAQIPENPGVKFNDCQGPFGLTFEVVHVGTWFLNGVSYNSATGVTTGTLDNIEADIVGPGCNATVTGSVNVTFTNSTDVLSVQPDFTLLVSFVDPANDCLGLINQGEHANFDGDFTITPGLTVTSP